jgi:hypothetical protein
VGGGADTADPPAAATGAGPDGNAPVGPPLVPADDAGGETGGPNGAGPPPPPKPAPNPREKSVGAAAGGIPAAPGEKPEPDVNSCVGKPPPPKPPNPPGASGILKPPSTPPSPPPELPAWTGEPPPPLPPNGIGPGGISPTSGWCKPARSFPRPLSPVDWSPGGCSPCPGGPPLGPTSG